MNIIRPLDRWLNGLTMYQIMLYGLALLAVAAIALGAGGVLGFPAPALLLSLACLVVVCYVANRLLATLVGAASGTESSLITALILFFLLPPPADARSFTFVAAAGVLAMASKYLLAWRRRHIFNPAAIAAAILGLTGWYPAIWWMATPALLPFVVVLGLLVVRKLRRFQLVASFVATALAVLLVVTRGQGAVEVLQMAFTSWPLVFLGAIMLTEPATLPPGRRDLLIYGMLVGGLFTSQLHAGPIYTTPEVALLVGNLWAYWRSPKFRLQLRLAGRTRLAPHIVEYRFTPERPLSFIAGQYMDMLLPHPRPDSRGNRRSFSLASSPGEAELRFATRLYEPSSSFKAALEAMTVGQTVTAGQLAGNFTLPADSSIRLVFIAGGIGITPFRSMVQALVGVREARDITLFYTAADPADFVYQSLFDSARSLGLKPHYLLTSATPPASWMGESGFLTPERLRTAVPQPDSAVYYLSGPNAMVDAYRRLLRQLGVPRRQIKTDYFSGY